MRQITYSTLDGEGESPNFSCLCLDHSDNFQFFKPLFQLIKRISSKLYVGQTICAKYERKMVNKLHICLCRLVIVLPFWQSGWGGGRSLTQVRNSYIYFEYYDYNFDNYEFFAVFIGTRHILAILYLGHILCVKVESTTVKKLHHGLYHDNIAELDCAFFYYTSSYIFGEDEVSS